MYDGQQLSSNFIQNVCDVLGVALFLSSYGVRVVWRFNGNDQQRNIDQTKLKESKISTILFFFFYVLCVCLCVYDVSKCGRNSMQVHVTLSSFPAPLGLLLLKKNIRRFETTEQHGTIILITHCIKCRLLLWKGLKRLTTTRVCRLTSPATAGDRWPSMGIPYLLLLQSHNFCSSFFAP